MFKYHEHIKVNFAARGTNPLVKNYEESVFTDVAPCNSHGVPSGVLR